MFVRLGFLLFGLGVLLCVGWSHARQLEYVDSVPFNDHYIKVYEDLQNRGRYYATPLVVLNLNSTKYVDNIFTGKKDVVFQIVLWSEGAQRTVHSFIQKFVNQSSRYELISMVPMTRMRLKWKHTTRPPTEMYRINEAWNSAEHQPTRALFQIECDTSVNCFLLKAAMERHPSVLRGLELEYISNGTAQETRKIPLTGSLLLNTDIGVGLADTDPWPVATSFRYLRSLDVTKLVNQAVRAFIANVPDGMQYQNNDDRAQLESMMTTMLKESEINSLLLPINAWNSVLWRPSYTRPDKLSIYLNAVLSSGGDSEYFILDSARRSLNSEGVQRLNNTSFLGVNVTNTTGRRQIHKGALLDVLGVRYPYVVFNGRHFILRAITLYRIDMSNVGPETVLTRLSVQATTAGVHSVPVRPENTRPEEQSGTIRQADIGELKMVNRALKAAMRNLTNAHASLSTAVSSLMGTSRTLSMSLANMTSVVSSLKQDLMRNREVTSGVVFTRWGRTECPRGSERIYRGFVVTSDRTTNGGMGMYMCLTDSPTYYRDGRGTGAGGILYRTEYVDNHGFLTTNAGTSSLKGHDMVCVTCRRPNKTSSVIVWGSGECTTGWSREYNGTINASKTSNKLSTNAICVDGAPEVVPNSSARIGSSEGFNYKSKCEGEVRCPPFDGTKAHTCAVCTK